MYFAFLSRFAFQVLGILVFLSFFAIDAVSTENIFQLHAFFLMFGCLTIRLIYAYLLSQSTLTLLSMIIDLLSLISYSALALGWIRCCGIENGIGDNFGYYVYKIVGPDPTLQEAWETYQKMVTFMMLDFAAAMIWITISFENLKELDFIFTVIAIGVSILLALLGWMAVVRESYLLLRIYWLGALAYPVYLVYEMYSLVSLQSSADSLSWAIFNIAASGGFSFLMRIVCVFWTYLAFLNFDLGLKERVFEKRTIINQVQSITGNLVVVLKDPLLTQE